MGLFKKDENKLSSSVVSIKINKLFGDKIPMTVAEFQAEQTKDESYNLTLKGDNGNFNEPVEILKHNIITMLKYKLDFSGKSVTEKLNAVDKAITSQEVRLKNLRSKDFIEKQEVENKETKEKEIKEVQVNKIDEENKLTQLKILRDSVKNEGDGSFEFINSQGQREMNFTLIDGILYPVFYNATKHTMYPANDTKKKIHREEAINLRDEYLEEIGGGQQSWFSYIMKIAMVVLLLGGFGFIYYTSQMSADAAKFWENSDTAKLERAATQCQIEIKECNQKFTNVLQELNNCVWDKNNALDKQVAENPNEVIDRVVNLG